MARTSPARILFLLALIFHGLLWSQSRYSRFRASGFVQAQGRNVSLPLVTSNECRPLDHPSNDQCAHVTKHCPDSDTILAIPYLHTYFCSEPPLRPFVFAGFIVWLLFLFSTLGISAADFFTPNLGTIAHLLGLDEDVAGVTFLAFGNGSPDLFSTYSAMRAQSGSLAIGELLGAASFIVSCVVGSMCIIKPFKVHRAPFLRDVGFFTLAVTMLLVTLWDEKIVWWEAASLIGLYISYVLVVIVGSWWDRRQERRRRLEAQIRGEYADEPLAESEVVFVEPPYQDNPDASALSSTPLNLNRARAISSPGPPRLTLETQLPRRPLSRVPSFEVTPSSRISHMPSFSLVGALEFKQVVASLQHEAAGTSLNVFETPITPYARGHYHAFPHSRSRRTSSREGDQWNAALGLPLDERSPQQALLPPGVTEEPEGPLDDAGDTVVPSFGHTPPTPTISDGDAESQVFIPKTRWERIKHVFGQVYHTLLPSLRNFKNKTFLGKIASILAAPAVMALTLTLPVVVTPYEGTKADQEMPMAPAEGRLIDFEEEGIERALIAEEDVFEEMHEMRFNKWLMATQCIFGPLFCVGVLFDGTKHITAIMIATAIASMALAVLVGAFANKGTHPSSRMAQCSMGFVVAIVWIMAIADEVVNVLQTFGHIFGLSNAIIGLTIFAVGNSLADLVANMAVAVFAPIMGFSACFGGPMLNILLGIGGSGSYMIHSSSQPYEIDFSPTLLTSSIGLLALLVATLVFVPLNGYVLTRRWGVFLIVSYAIIMLVNIGTELRHRGWEAGVRRFGSG